MKNIFKFMILVGFVGILASCEDYLNEPKPTDQTTSEVIFGSREGVEAYISGITRRMRAQWNSTTDVGGIYSMYFARSIKGNDLIQKPTWYLYDYAHENREPTYRRTRETWNLLYHLIDHANTLIEGVETSEELSDEDKTEFVAYGKGLRAYLYLQLTLEYQTAYPAAGRDAFAPPLYLKSSLEGEPMSTMGAMYDQMIMDINDAVAGLPEERLGKSYLNKSVANGIKARILMSMGTEADWAEVEAAANAAYGDDVATAVAIDYTDGFSDVESPGWMWGMDQSGDQSAYYYTAAHAFTDHYVLSYAATFINAHFVDTFSVTDVRNLFVNGYGAPAGNWQEYITTKFTFTFSSDMPIMRYAEMLLVEAEALARQGEDGAANDLLFALQSARDAAAVKSGNTGDDLIQEILLERRKELYGEMGVEWFDAKRNQTGITRDPNHRVVVDLKPNDNRFYLKIPEQEINANPHIDLSINDGR